MKKQNSSEKVVDFSIRIRYNGHRYSRGKDYFYMEKLYRYVNGETDLSYYVATPENYDPKKKYPLIVALHGAGTFGDNPKAILSNPEYVGYKKFAPDAILLCPHTHFEVWSSQVRRLKEVIDLVCDAYPVDMLRVSICGGSMGGFGVWEMLCSYPNFFAAACAICGGGMAWRSGCIAALPIRVYHGDKDETVLPERSAEMVNAMKAAAPDNKELEFILCENTGHDSWNRPYLEDNIFAWLISHKRRRFTVYAGGPEKGSGLYRYTLSDGKMYFEEKYPDEGIMYLKIKRGKLYALLNEPFGNREGGLVRYDIHEDRLTARTPVFPTYGKASCHVEVDDEGNAYIANYLTGSVTKINLSTGTAQCVYHDGDGVSKPRQDKEHTHQIAFTPDGKYLTVCDLGTDTIHVYDKNLCEVSNVSAVPGSGPRHLVFSSDGAYAYCVNELDNTVTVYAYADGVLSRLDSYDMLPFGYEGLTTAAAIRLCGNYLYVSTRGHDSITRFAVDGARLTYVDNTKVQGTRPRDIHISPDGKSLICANEGGTLTLFDIGKDGSLTFTGTEFEVPSALCVVFN